jgi:TM2 domain
MTSRYRSKALAAWLALIGGAFGAHRFYLYGARDVLAWLHPGPTLVGLAGIARVQNLGQDDRWSWVLLPVLGLMISQACLSAIVYGLTSDEKWDAKRNPGLAPRQTRWAPVLAVILALTVGAVAFIGTIAFGGQRFFEWQLEETRLSG